MLSINLTAPTQICQVFKGRNFLIMLNFFREIVEYMNETLNRLFSTGRSNSLFGAHGNSENPLPMVNSCYKEDVFFESLVHDCVCDGTQLQFLSKLAQNTKYRLVIISRSHQSVNRTCAQWHFDHS